MPRLGHKKSRNGCVQCKTRHVKCDEQRPCSNCARHGVPCSLVTCDDPNVPLPPVPIKQEPPTPSSSTSLTKVLSERQKKPSPHVSTPGSLPIEDVTNPSPAPTADSSEGSSPYSQTDTYPFLTKFIQKNDTLHPDYWIRDLELMHHWCTEAFLTITTREDLQQMWQITAPKQATDCHFLMHELLAFSALHKAYLQEELQRTYYALGIHHQDLSIRALRKTLPRLSFENAGALFATSSIMTLCLFGSTGLDAKDPNTESRPLFEDLLDIFILQQGMTSILSAGNDYVREGPFAAIIGRSSVEVPQQPFLQVLLEHITTFASFSEIQSLSKEVEREVTLTIEAFKEILLFAMSPFIDNRELRFVFFWPVRLSQNFLQMVRQKQSCALAVVAYYAVALRLTEPLFWFMDGWGERVIRAVFEAIEPSWQPAVQWPWEFIMKAQQNEA
ncbi:hypothetical protein K491DRAFT_590692 [Lophiostoma macrostomum CBS 122681]|uniref:Zn(2)-C6 fungal-type domain-containing protein n=1 Tax=Lophiostoma macrostomum CBS 122681 TaxID=1314788 RepID=A0A6A6TJW6_9PLEO|nr:hypothetical protein K491DRAFT_590692 [Lophiostoma macrostomum CBS 122681]